MFYLLRWAAALATVLPLSVVLGCWAQSSSQAIPSESKVVLVKLSPPIYPGVARNAHISGDLLVLVEIGKDGTVLSANVESGPALILLRQAALESAKHSQFECRDCADTPESFQMLFSFELDPTEYCAQNASIPSKSEVPQPYPRTSHSGNHVIIVDRPIGTCDMAAQSGKVRSAKCLYLWKCDSR